MGNKSAKQELIKRYGEECFIEKLHLKENPVLKSYTCKEQKKLKQLTYHHIKMKKDGGKATVENGALLSVENHEWFHQQDPCLQDYMNAMFQEYKKQIDSINGVDKKKPSNKIKVRASVMTIDERGIMKFNRAKEKQNERKMINNYYDEQER